jgi:FtsZ-binding cell division protein ZapB
MKEIDQEIATLLANWQANAEQAVRLCRLLESQIESAERRCESLANEVQTERNARIALVKENTALIAELELLRARVTQRGAQA